MDKKSWYTLMVYGAIILIAVSFLAGIAVNNVYHPVQVVTENVTVYRDRWHEPKVVTVNHIEYVKVPEIITEYVTVNKTIEKIVYSDLNYIPWQSKQEVENWLNENWGRSYVDTVDCDEVARELTELAASQNRLIGILAKYPAGATEWHCVNFFIVGNYCYELEPQTGQIKGIWGTLD